MKEQYISDRNVFWQVCKSHFLVFFERLVAFQEKINILLYYFGAQGFCKHEKVCKFSSNNMVYPQCLELKANTKGAINPPTPTLVSPHPTGVLIPPRPSQLLAITVASSAITDDTGLKETEFQEVCRSIPWETSNKLRFSIVL